MISCRDEVAICNMGHHAPTCRTALGRVIEIIARCRKVEATVDHKEESKFAKLSAILESLAAWEGNINSKHKS